MVKKVTVLTNENLVLDISGRRFAMMPWPDFDVSDWLVGRKTDGMSM